MNNSPCSPQWRTERVIFCHCGYLNKNLTSLLKLNQIQLAYYLHLYYFEICVPLWGNLETLKQEIKDEKWYLIPYYLTLHHPSLILLNLYPNLSVAQITELDLDDREVTHEDRHVKQPFSSIIHLYSFNAKISTFSQKHFLGLM